MSNYSSILMMITKITIKIFNINTEMIQDQSKDILIEPKARLRRHLKK